MKRLRNGHQVVASILAASAKEATAALATLPASVTLAEIRLDGLWPHVPDADAATDDLLTLADAPGPPRLATLRPKRQGGRFEGPEQVRLGLLQSALRAGFAAADLEMDGLDPSGRVKLLRPDGALVASVHWHETPCRSDGLNALLGMQDLQVAYDKLAFPAGAFPDLLRAFEFTRAHAERGGRPSVATLQHGGPQTRAALAIAGNCATYGAAPGLPAAAPGQPAIQDVLDLWAQWGITQADLDLRAGSRAPWLAVLGHPVEHSKSPRIHNAALRAAGRPERFVALDVPASASALRLMLHVAPRIGLAGASVTAPHKSDAARIATGDELVTRTGSANCLRFTPEAVQATNTDYTALHRLLRPYASGADALVLGAGGAARSAVAALLDLGAKVTVASRDAARARAAVDLGATWIAWSQAASHKAALAVQATPLGADAAVAPRPGPGVQCAVELVYAAGDTPFQAVAKQHGAQVITGEDVLVAQAVDAFRFWTGQAPDEGVLRRALA